MGRPVARRAGATGRLRAGTEGYPGGRTRRTLGIGRPFRRAVPTGCRSMETRPNAVDRALPGDLLLARSRGAVYRAGRAFARNRFDHVAVVLDGDRTANLVLGGTVILPLERFRRLETALMRPAWADPDQRDAFLRAMQRFADVRYDVAKTFLGMFATALRERTGIAVPLRRPGPGTARWICTEAILDSLGRAMPAFREIEALDLDAVRIGFATTNDFLRIARERPDLLAIVAP